MPAPIDWTAAGGRDSVRQLTITHGPREAARMLNLSPAHAEALRRICSRERWLDAVRAVPPPVPASMLQPVQRMPVPSGEALSPTVQSNIVPAVPTAADAQAEANADHSRRGRAALLRYGAEKAEHAASLPDDVGLAVAPLVASLARTLATAGDWQQSSPAPTLTLNLFSVGGQMDKPVLDV